VAVSVAVVVVVVVAVAVAAALDDRYSSNLKEFCTENPWEERL
jgi:hypothetical protein